jgi:DNA-binding MarR family transcriptional regulator
VAIRLGRFLGGTWSVRARHTDGADVRTVVDSLRRIVRAFRISARALEGRLGISAAQLFVLHQLKENDASSIDELAARTLTHQSSVSVVVGRLAERGLVTRRIAADDARRTEIALTADGRALLRKAPEVMQERLIGALARLGPRQLRDLARQLSALVRALEIDRGRAGMFFEDESAVARRRISRQLPRRAR